MSGAPSNYRIGIDLGGTKISGVLLDPQNQTVAKHRIATPQGDYAATLAAIAAMVDRVTMSLAAPQRTNLPVGIGTPGAARADGAMVNCNSQCLNGQQLRRDLRSMLGREVRLANDADCFALAESHLLAESENSVAGSDPDFGLLFGVILGTGVGGGWVYQGQLLQGPNALAGEWGHTPLAYFRSDPNQCATLRKLEAKLTDRSCYCGRINCVETFLSGPGLAQTHAELWGESQTAQQIAQTTAAPTSAAQASATKTVELYISMLGRCLAQVINAVDPAIVVLGGGLSNITVLYEELPLVIAQSLFGRDDCATRILRARGGDDSGLYGAANLFS